MFYDIFDPANMTSAMVDVSMFPSLTKLDNSYYYLVVNLTCSFVVFINKAVCISTTKGLDHTYTR